MSASSGTGSFWKCPECGKHVPSRLSACRYGFDRSHATAAVVDVHLQQPPVVAESRSGGRAWIVGAILAAGALAGGAYAVTRPVPDPADTPLARRIRAARERQAPQVVYVPVPVEAPPGAVPAGARVAGAVEPVQELPAPEMPAPPLSPAADAARAAAETISIAPVAAPQESEVDVKRRLGAVEFDRDMAVLSHKADQADVAWQRFVEGCRLNISSVTAVAGVADRDWIAFAGANVTQTQWTAACAEAGTFFALARQVRDGVCLAEDRARANWVYPGTRRDERRRYRLDWDGWETACR